MTHGQSVTLGQPFLQQRGKKIRTDGSTYIPRILWLNRAASVLGGQGLSRVHADEKVVEADLGTIRLVFKYNQTHACFYDSKNPSAERFM